MFFCYRKAVIAWYQIIVGDISPLEITALGIGNLSPWYLLRLSLQALRERPFSS